MLFKKTLFIAIFAFFVQVVLISASFAQIDKRLNILQECYKQEDPDKRLLCYDTLAGKLAESLSVDEPSFSAALSSKVLASVESSSKASSINDVDEPQFGFEWQPEKRKVAELPDSIVFVVVKVTKDRYRKTRSFHAEGGQVWRQIEPGYISFPKGSVFKVVISKGAMGDYRLRVNGKGKMTKVKRIR